MGDVSGPAYGVAILAAVLTLVRQRADRDGRRSSLAALLWTTISAARAEIGVLSTGLALVAIDVVLVGLLITLAWRCRHGGPVLAIVIQGLGLAALLANALDPRISDASTTLVSLTTTHAVALVLFTGAWAQRRQSVL